MIALSVALLALIGLPGPLTSYRELGVLRRMSTTPVPPSWVLGAQVVVNLALFSVAVLVVVLGGAAFVRICHCRCRPSYSPRCWRRPPCSPWDSGGGGRTHPAGGRCDRRRAVLPHGVFRERVAAT